MSRWYVGLLVGSVGVVTLAPVLYVLFHAWQWTVALRLIEAAFVPALALSFLAGLVVYRRHQAERQEEDQS